MPWAALIRTVNTSHLKTLQPGACRQADGEVPFCSSRDTYPRPRVEECLSARIFTPVLVPRTRGASDVLESPSEFVRPLARLLAA